MHTFFKGHSDALPQENWLFNQKALQEYLLICCQVRLLLEMQFKTLLDMFNLVLGPSRWARGQAGKVT